MTASYDMSLLRGAATAHARASAIRGACVLLLGFGFIARVTHDTAVIMDVGATLDDFAFKSSAEVSSDERHACVVTRDCPEIRVLVSYVYYEAETESAAHRCEVDNKRTNLAFFLTFAVGASSPDNVHFRITFSGRRPSAEEVLRSAGMSPTSDTAQHISRVLASQVVHVHVGASPFTKPAADLCHHYHSISAAAEDRKTTYDYDYDYDYVVVTNDGVRGPFFDAQLSADIASTLPFTNVPLWLAKYIALAVHKDNNRLVGSVMSCEQDTHVQSWFLVMDRRIVHAIVMPHFNATCVPGLMWKKAVGHEVQISVDVLAQGGGLAAVYPHFKTFTSKHRRAVRVDKNKTWLGKMHGCANMLRYDASHFLNMLESPADLVMVKYGGDLFRSKLLSDAFVTRVHAETHAAFRVDDGDRTASTSCYLREGMR